MPTFTCYLDNAGRNVIRRWRDELNDSRLRAHIDTVLEALEKQPRIEWPRKRWDYMQGKPWSGIGEVRFDYRGTKYRIFAFEREDQVVLLRAAKKIEQKGNLAALATPMQNRRAEVEGGAKVEPYFP